MSTERIGLKSHQHPETRKGVDLHGHQLPPPAVSNVKLPDREDRRPRRLNAQACAADTLLSHSIEYLTDARKLPNGKIGRLSPDEPDVQAVMLLMVARHDIYMACPVIERRAKTGLFGLFKGPDRRGR